MTMAYIAEASEQADAHAPSGPAAPFDRIDELAHTANVRLTLQHAGREASRFGVAGGDPVTLLTRDPSGFWAARAHENALLLAGTLRVSGPRSAITRGLGLLHTIEPRGPEGQPGRWSALAYVDQRATPEAIRTLPPRLGADSHDHQIRLTAFILTHQPPACRELELRLILRAAARGYITPRALAALTDRLIEAAGPALPPLDARRLRRTLAPLTTGTGDPARAQIDARRALLDHLAVADTRHVHLHTTRAMRRHARHDQRSTDHG